MKTIKRIVIGIAVIYGLLVVGAYLPHEELPVSSFTGPESKFIDINGQALHYIKKGTGKPLVLVHGFAGSTYTWRKLIPLLSDTYTIYALDLLGFGLSDKPKNADYSLQAQAARVNAFITAAGLKQVSLAGHSMGGVVVAFSAVQNPKLIEKLIIIEGGFYHGGAPAFLQYLFFPLDRIMARTFYTRNARLRSLEPSYYDKEHITEDVIEANLMPGKTPGAIDALATMMATVGYEIYSGLAERISQPTLLVWSLHNKNNPVEDAQRLQSEISNARLALIESCGHYVQEEQPQKLAAAVREFLQ